MARIRKTLEQRRRDQVFVDQRVDAHGRLPDYVKQGSKSWTAVFRKLDESARVVIGPKGSQNYSNSNETKILAVKDHDAFKSSFGDITRLPGIEVPNTRYFYRSHPLPSHLLHFVKQIFKAKESFRMCTNNETPLVLFSGELKAKKKLNIGNWLLTGQKLSCRRLVTKLTC